MKLCLKKVLFSLIFIYCALLQLILCLLSNLNCGNAPAMKLLRFKYAAVSSAL